MDNVTLELQKQKTIYWIVIIGVWMFWIIAGNNDEFPNATHTAATAVLIALGLSIYLQQEVEEPRSIKKLVGTIFVTYPIFMLAGLLITSILYAIFGWQFSESLENTLITQVITTVTTVGILRFVRQDARDRKAKGS